MSDRRDPDLNGLSVEAARSRMLAGAGRLGVEAVDLGASLGRVLAEDVIAPRDQPPFDASAMDGWAICRSALTPDAVFEVCGESAAGHGYAGLVGPGQAVRIFTGAPLPEGADLVVIQENAVLDGDTVRFVLSGAPPSNTRPRGGDFRQGEALLAAGQRLDPWRLSLAAAAGRGRLSVARRPRVAILATGDELIQPGQAPGDHQIFDSGTPALAALIAEWGGEPLRLRAAVDRAEAIAAAVAEVPADLILTIGGASVGDYDLVKPALTGLGLELRVETIAVRPGKPTWSGRLADGRRVLGLPGNPASALVCAELFLRPLLAALTGADPALPLRTARLASPLPANGPREHWLRAALDVDGQGQLTASPFADQDSSMIGVFSRADALLMRPAAAAAAPAGEAVTVLPLRRA